MKRLTALTAAVAASLISWQAQAALIDDFDDTTALISTSTVGGSASAITAGGMIGGERDIRIEKLATPGGQGGGTGSVTAEVTGSRFIYGQSGSSFGRATLQWDGVDGDAVALNTTGLGSQDLTSAGAANGFVFNVYSDGGNVGPPPQSPAAEILITVFGADGVSKAEYQFSAFNTAVLITDNILFSDPFWTFTGGFTAASFASVGAVEVVINVFGDNASLDVELDLIESNLVPEPSSILLAGLALTGIGAVSRRRRIK